MDTLSNGALVLPWPIDPAQLLQMVELAMFAVALVTGAGLVYGILHRVLCNRSDFSSVSTRTLKPISDHYVNHGGTVWPLSLKVTFQESVYDEA